MVLTDGELLRRVLDNLLENALKYTEPGTKVSLTAHDDEDGIEGDEGPGIPAQDRERVFAKQTKTRFDGSPANTGRGLSLRFCQLAMTALGGRIWAEANEPRGACFCLRLPRSQAWSSAQQS